MESTNCILKTENVKEYLLPKWDEFISMIENDASQKQASNISGY
jgi:hypothetical protein